MPDRDIRAAVAEVQRSVVVPKARYNAFGKFSYRSYEDIVSALKEPCREAGVAFVLCDGIERVGDRHYVRATATAFFTDGTPGELSATAYAREDEHKKGSDDAQVTGMASSYARKYALCGLFGVAAALNGFFIRKIPLPLRAILLVGGLCMIIPGTVTDLIGLVMIAATALYQQMMLRKETPAAA